ncbi:MAG: Npt1/Npt2 family nucleotide transporter [Waddliaceae bacterium]
MKNSLANDFGRIRSFFWPIYPSECRLVIPMLLMFFLVCFNYSIIRCIKDSIVITAAGAEVLPFIKVWVLLPMAVLLTYIFIQLTHRFSYEKVVYIMTSSFLVFYLLFAFVLYPARDYIHPHSLAETLEAALPRGFRGLISMFRYWSFTGFYVVVELWGSIILSVLFWGFANEVTKVTEARRYYGVISVGSNLAAFLAGQAANYFSMGEIYNANLPFGQTAWEQTLMILVILVVICGIIIMGIFRWLNQNVLKDRRFDHFHESEPKINKKRKLSVRESLTYLKNSKYLACIAILVISYNLAIGLVEIIWKDQLSILYPSPADFNRYMNNLTSTGGMISTIIAFFLPWFMSKCGWTKTALLTPLIILVTSVGFFIVLFVQNSFSHAFFTALGTSPLGLVVFFGALQNCLSKAAKYSVFDTTNNISFIPLEHDIKLNGKAAIDGVGSRFGKFGGSLLYQGLLMFFGGIIACAPYVGAIVLAVIILWVVSTQSLGNQFEALVKETKNKEGDRVTAREEREPLVTDKHPVTV